MCAGNTTALSSIFLSLLLYLRLIAEVYCGAADCKGTNVTELAPFLMLEDSDTESGGLCRCWEEPYSPECECRGDNIQTVPGNLSRGLERLTIKQSGIKEFKTDSLQAYRDTLMELTLLNNQQLSHLDPGLFSSLPNLKTLYIVHAPLLKSLNVNILRIQLPKLLVMRIVLCGLEELPQITQAHPDQHITMVDMESNQIKRLMRHQFRITADHLVLNHNQIEVIENFAFEGSQIEKLSLGGNKLLTRLDPDAFSGIKSLRVLDLSDTSITYLPTKGLQDLEKFYLENVRTLKVFPSIYNFPHILQVSLTYAYHCCAFHYPSRHDPTRYRKHQEFLAKIAAKCPKMRGKRSWGAPISTGHHEPTETFEGTFHQEAFNNLSETKGRKMLAECGNLSKDYRQVDCTPVPDAFNPCEDLMGNWGLRVAVWFVAIAALLGNTAVLLVLLSSRFRMTVPKFLMCNLALADLCMGVYLLMIAVMDAKSIGDYFNYAIDWQSGNGCRIAGFLTVFSSELSILTLTVITCERWYTITYAIHMNKRLKLSTAMKIMAAGWLYAILMAALPLVGVSGYFKTSICLPLEKSASIDMAYLTTLLAFNGIAFWVICLCYGKMYCSIRRGREAGAALYSSDMTVAKRMALLVFTDFACWAPIAFFGLTALVDYPLINVTNTKILLVFFYPLNSCANPYLYALLTHQYRWDVVILLSRYGLCTERAARLKAGGTGGGGGPGGGAARGQRPTGRGSVLTTLTSLDCARQHSLGPLPEVTLPANNGTTHGTSTV
ncbi:lutropin-choriogonadotropic hormone receptor isoform X2 [Halyomorpha halys]|uniref:lutropin-choriogonadotropic hormone receptor isoform X2 n=1 Tax=Halyomorpha halys TaxID=286706 RepID=UPI0034D2F920